MYQQPSSSFFFSCGALSNAIKDLLRLVPAEFDDKELIEKNIIVELLKNKKGESHREILLSILESVQNNGCAVIKNVSTDHRALFIFGYLLRLTPFYSSRVGYCHTFEVSPFSDDLSETSESGGFHTDFSTLIEPPDIGAIACVRVDPRHPYYGRNQVAPAKEIIEKFVNYFGEKSIDLLKNLVIPHRFGSEIRYIKFLEFNSNNAVYLRFHYKLVAKDLLNSSHIINNLPIHEWIKIFSTQVSNDFVLNEGDILFFSNKSALHKRSEATFSYFQTHEVWRGRIIHTVRFNV